MNVRQAPSPHLFFGSNDTEKGLLILISLYHFLELLTNLAV